MNPATAKAPRLGLLLVGLPLAGLLLPVGLAICVALLSSGSASACGAAESVGSVSDKEVPARLIPIYEQAAARYHLGPRGPSILAAINWNESSFGTNMATSEAGAIGWMAFLPSSWEAFGVDANHDGAKDPYNPWDAIFAAARLLRYSGAPGDWRGAIFSYNHAEWYVEDVLADAEKFAGGGSVEVSSEATTCDAAFGPEPELVKRMLAASYREAEKKLPYIWGGFDPNVGFDCSGGVSWVLGIGGFFSGRTDTQGLAAWGAPGAGNFITVYIKTTGDAEEEHTAIEIAGVLFESGGWGEDQNPSGGWGVVDSKQAKGFLAHFDTRRHPQGF